VKKRVLAVGEVNIDIVLTGLAHIPRSEQDVLAQEMEILVGGQTGTIARALSCLGVYVTFVGRVGDDEYGRKAIEQLRKDGVDVSGVVINPNLRTGVTVVLSTGRERAFATYMGSISEVHRADVKREFLHSVDHIHVGSYYLQRALHPKMKGLFEEAKQLGLTVSLDPGWDSFEEWGPGILDVLTRVDVFIPNEIVAMTITQTDTPEEALEVLGERVDIVVIKMGAEGCLARNEEETISCPAFEVPVVDVTSAGDVFNAGFIYAFLNGWDLGVATRFANACGAIAVGKVGSSGIISGVQEVKNFLTSRSQ
jgi:sugar/nucleoside kinase (ribokinase family)